MNLGYDKLTLTEDPLETVKKKVKAMKFVMPRTMNDYYCNDLLDTVVCIISEEQRKGGSNEN